MVETSPLSNPRKALVFAAAIALAAVGLAATASAVETMDPRQAGSGDCPALTAAKYPWLVCTPNEHGGVTLSMPGHTEPKACNWELPTGECAAGPREWGLVPSIPPSVD